MIKLAFLGCGDVAQRDYLPEFHRLADRAEIVAICGKSSRRVHEVADRFAIPHRFTDYREMLAQPDVDAVVNLTPIQLHAETNLACLRAGKHVYSEKPLASSVAHARAIEMLAHSRNLKLVCAPCVMLFPQVRFARQLLEEQAIGQVYSARAYAHMGVPPWRGYGSDPSPFFAAGGGPALDMGVYPLHVLTDLLGPVQRVTAFVSKVMESFVVEDGPVAGKRVPVEADDNWQMLLDFGGGRLASLAANSIAVDSRAPMVEFHGLQGTVALDAIDVSAPVHLLTVGQGWRQIEPPFPVERSQGRSAGPDHHLGVEHLVECILHDREPILNARHAVHVIEVIEQAAASARSGQAMAIRSSVVLSSD
jgi:predicted dehydrogenase